MSSIYKEHIIQYGETLQSITQRYLGSMENWKSIADFNNLKYPYIVETVEEKNSNPEKWVTIGDTILIELPVEANNFDAIEQSLNDADKERIYSLALGSDLHVLGGELDNHYGLLHSDRFPNEQSPRFGSRDDTLYITDNLKGDVKTVSGFENLRQSLWIRLITDKGSYVGHPTFGSELYKYVGWRNATEAVTLLDLEIERTLREDGRVSDVEKVESRLEEASYYGYFKVTPQGLEESFNFILNIPDGEPLALIDDF